MKLRLIIFLAISATLLAACNFSLAADVTPPPGYVAPPPLPTLGPLYPASAPDIENGAAIYTKKCAACHGDTGLGNGPEGKQLPVSVAAFALPETARKASPVKWFTIVSQGNINRFMPPFSSLSDQERWDVVAYALTLHTTPEQIKAGKSLFEKNCADCAKFFSSQEMISALTADDIVKIIKEGTDEVPAFGSNFSDEEAYAVAAYIRTLTFAPPPAPIVDSAIETPAAAEAGTPSAEATPLEGTAQAQVTPEASVEPAVVSVSKVSGVIENRSGVKFPSDLKVTLRGFDHSSDPSAGPQEILKLEGSVNADGTFSFETEIAENQIYLAEFEVDGLSYQSEYAVVPADTTELSIPRIIVYATTEDFSALKIDSVDVFFDLASEDTAQIFSVYTISNTGDETIIVKMGDGESVPFLGFPEGAKGLGYEATQDSAAFVPTADGFAIPPSETTYGLIAFASLPKTKEINISQPAYLSIGDVTLYLPEGVEAEGAALTDNGVQKLQTANFRVYTAGAVNKGGSIEFMLTGKPKDTAAAATAAATPNNRPLLIGVGVLGAALVLAGLWMYVRDRDKEEEIEDEEDEFDGPESIMDAIITIDDLHRAGKIPQEAYKQRRDELMEALKRKE